MHKQLLTSEIVQLVGVLTGVQEAGTLMRLVLDFLEDGVEESWYEVQMRRRYGGARVRQVDSLSRPREKGSSQECRQKPQEVLRSSNC